MTRALIALGSNLGQSLDTLTQAVSDLAAVQGVQVVRVSPIARTAPVGGPEGQPDYVNMVAQLETSLGPYKLLEVCQQIEAKHHRKRLVRWGPRTLDLDMITYGDLTQDDPALTLPHPRASQRAFVLAPWARMDPQALLAGQLVAQLAAAAPDADGIREFLPAPEVPECPSA